MIGRPYDEGIEQEGSIMRITSATMYKYNWTVSPGYTGTLGLPIFNPYRFAYNGIERVDEKAGRANHYTALYGEYDVRKVHRENQDPKFTYGISPYVMFKSNPIWYNDPLLDDPAKRAYRYAKRHGMKDADFSITPINNKKDVHLNYGISGGVAAKKFKYNFWDKLEDMTSRGGAFDKGTYKVAVEYNPLTKSITNLFSSVFGKDLTVQSYDEVQKGGAMSGKDISTGRRVTTGVQGVTGLVGIGLGGASGVASDMTLDGVSDGWNLSSTNSTMLKLSKAIYDFRRNVTKDPIKAVIEFYNFGVGTTAEKVDEKLKKKD